MRSRTPKALQVIGGRTLLEHVVAAVTEVGGAELAIVVGPDHGTVETLARAVAPKAQIFEQSERRGTAHAMLMAKQAIARKPDDILVIFADTPLLRPQTLAQLRAVLAGAAVAVLGFRPANPEGYGRLVMRGAFGASLSRRDVSS